MRGVLSVGFALILPVATSLSSQGQTAADLQQKAAALEQAGNAAGAAAAWRAFLKVQPANAEAYAHLGFLEAQQEHYREAIPFYKKALTLTRQEPERRLLERRIAELQ